MPETPSSLTGYILPNPKAPKAIGFWSIVFSCLLLSCGVCSLSMLVLSPVMNKMMASWGTQVQTTMDQQRELQVKAIEAEAAAETDPAIKKTIEDRAAAIKAQKAPVMPKISADMGIYENPMVRNYYLAEYLSMVVLNSLMLVSGIGLMGLKEWARKMAIWVAGLKIARLLLFTVVSIMVISPIIMDRMGKTFAEIENQSKQANPNMGPRAGGMPPMGQFTEIIQAYVNIAVPIWAALAMIFPVIVIAVLTRKRVRAACLPELSGEDGPS